MLHSPNRSVRCSLYLFLALLAFAADSRADELLFRVDPEFSIAKVEAGLGPVDVIVNNAGITRDATMKKMNRQAWDEVLARSPEADTPGMRAQFVCHWQFAEVAQPGKTSWNLEPWRPVVDDAEMFASRCNPGHSEEPF